MWHNFLKKIVQFVDPKLDRYRTPTKTTPPKYTPTSLADFIDVLRRTPRNILSAQDRDRIAAIMSFDDRHISDLMTDKSDMIFVKNTEVLGPLILDKLYKSGFTHFPVIDNKSQVIGIIHTEALNALEIKKTDRASKYLDPVVHYLHTDDTLNFAIEEIERTGSYFFLILDPQDNTVGCFTIKSLLDYLLN